MNNHVVIIGASVSGHNIALRLREKDKGCRITLVSEEGYPAYDHLKLVDFISGIISEKDIFLCCEEDYSKFEIDFIKNKKVGSINIPKKTVYFKDKGSINYDILVVASGRSPALPVIPGAKKEGVYRIYSLDDAKNFIQRYIVHPVCVVGSNCFALKIAEAVSEKHGVEVKLLSRVAFDPVSIPRNTEVINDSITEIIGEGETQAIKLASGKVLGVCAVLFMDDYKSNIEFLKDTGIEIKDDFVIVDGFMRTNQDNIFACGSVVHKDSVLISMMLVDHIVAKLGELNAQKNINAIN